MTNEEAFLAWAPPEVRWSDWAKPVAFAQRPPAPGTGAPAAPPADVSGASPGVVPPPASPSPPADVLQGWQSLPIDWLPPPGDTAVVADLPGTLSVAYGLALAQRGYRPVPLYNACTGSAEIVNMQQISRALFDAAPQLAELRIPELAPPAFLLDAQRLEGGQLAKPGRFDNRWMVFPQDFPSANLLLAQRIRRVLLVRNGPSQVPDDLAHVLLRWQDAGMEILFQDALQAGPAQPLQVTRPKRFKSAWYRLLAIAGLVRSSAGGFGSVIPQPSSGVG